MTASVLLKNYAIALDLELTPANTTFNVSQNDLNVVELNFTILTNGVALDLTGCTVRLALKKPSGLIVYQDCTITTANQGKASVLLTSQGYTEVGQHTAELNITDTANNAVSVTSQFTYQSRASLLSNNVVASNNTWQSINTALLGYDLKTDTIDWTRLVNVPNFAGGASSVDWSAVTAKPSVFAPDMTNVALVNALAGKMSVGASVAWASLTGTPTTVLGYGISDALTASSSLAWVKLTGVPTTLTGYGISDAYTKTQTDGKYAPLAGAAFTGNVTTTGDMSAVNVYENGTVLSSKYAPITGSTTYATQTALSTTNANVSTLQGQLGSLKVTTITQTAYNALGASVDANTVYLING